MDDKLVKRYQKYARSEEAHSVFFVKKNLLNAKGHWIDIIAFERCYQASDNLHFKFVLGRLFKRKIHPKYPDKSEFITNGKFDENRYALVVRAITWETAHKDIEEQKSKKTIGKKFKITGVYYQNKNNSFFVENTPPEIKELEKNLNDRTNPLWDKAMKYINNAEYVYKIKKIKFY